LQSVRREAQDGLRGFCRNLDDILMTGQGRFNEFAAVMTLSLSGVYAGANTSRVLKVFAASFGSFFFACELAPDHYHAERGNDQG
jgi:hypothetical protein